MSTTLITADELYQRVDHVVPAVEWATMADDVNAIMRLKAERNAVILAHNYMRPEIFHGISDIVGDSLALAREATTVEADVIVQCGVHFMAETSKILNPAKTVLMPDMEAGCSLAESITAEGIAEMRARYPGAPVVNLILNTVLQVFEDFAYHRELVSADGLNVVLEFSAKVGGRELKGIDIIRFDEAGKIVEFEVMVRPMSGLAALGEEMGRRLAPYLAAKPA